MCLTLKQNYKTRREAREGLKKVKPRIAKKDIIVYKRIYLQNNKKEGYSPYKNFVYNKGYQYHENKFTINVESYYGDWNIVINEGLHADISRSTSLYNIRHAFDNRKTSIIQMIIPKGSEYFLGKNNDIVTNNLIWY